MEVAPPPQKMKVWANDQQLSNEGALRSMKPSVVQPTTTFSVNPPGLDKTESTESFRQSVSHAETGRGRTMNEKVVCSGFLGFLLQCSAVA